MQPNPITLPVKQDRCLGYQCAVASQCARFSFHIWQTFGPKTKQVARYCGPEPKPTPILLEKT